MGRGELSEALGQLGQDEPASGMALEPLDSLSPISGSVAIGIHHRNSKVARTSEATWVTRNQGHTPP